eukprot:g52781.t1
MVPLLWSVCLLLPLGLVSAKGSNPASDLYIVQMLGEPVISYMKGKVGDDWQTEESAQYAQKLNEMHSNACAAAGVTSMAYSYCYSLNGFAARLTLEQAKALRANADVISVTRDEGFQPTTSRTPDMLKLTGPNGAWAQSGGQDRAGEDIIVGVLDTGLWPENPSFGDTGRDYGPVPARWKGICEEGLDGSWTAADCNLKVIGARYYTGSYGGVIPETDYYSARDSDGHGTLSAGIAVGNSNVEVAVGDQVVTISGIAPRARLAVYKVCFGGSAICYYSDMLQAVEDCIKDGVDVIEYPIAPFFPESVLNVMDLPFLQATLAGIFVAQSAGNGGPSASSVANQAPWNTAVAAGTKDKQYQATVFLGNGEKYLGSSLSEATDMAPLILARNAKLSTAHPYAASRCDLDTLDPALVRGKIVVCERANYLREGGNAASSVFQAGGIGAILLNVRLGDDTTQAFKNEFQEVPSVALGQSYADAIIRYAERQGATARLGAYSLNDAVAPEVAYFSARGPPLLGQGFNLKPDIIGPGVEVLAPYSPVGYGGGNFTFAIGTSFSSPHIAGLAAFLKGVHPDWSPAGIKSALMTTATTQRNDGSEIGDSYSIGAGFPVSTSALDPGLLHLVKGTDYLDWVCALTSNGQQQADGYLDPDACDPSLERPDMVQLNVPSIVITFAVDQTVKRTVTAVHNGTITYQVSLSENLARIATVRPASLTLSKGQSADYYVTFTADPASQTYNNTMGDIIWRGGNYVVRIPVAAESVQFLPAPLSVAGTGEQISYSVQVGWNGYFGATPIGVQASQEIKGELIGPSNLPTASFSKVVLVGQGTALFRAQIFNSETNPGNDIDLELYKDGKFINGSFGGRSNEEISLWYPVPGLYKVVVQLWADVYDVTPFILHLWGIKPCVTDVTLSVQRPGGNAAGVVYIQLKFQKLKKNRRYLGAVQYEGVDSNGKYLPLSPPYTPVSVNTKQMQGDGKDGKDGKDAIDGQDGKDAIDGQDGKDAIDGQDGKDAIDGQDYYTAGSGKYPHEAEKHFTDEQDEDEAHLLVFQDEDEQEQDEDETYLHVANNQKLHLQPEEVVRKLRERKNTVMADEQTEAPKWIVPTTVACTFALAGLFWIRRSASCRRRLNKKWDTTAPPELTGCWEYSEVSRTQLLQNRDRLWTQSEPG